MAAVDIKSSSGGGGGATAASVDKLRGLGVPLVLPPVEEEEAEKEDVEVGEDTCDRGGSHWVAFHFPLLGSAEFFVSLGNAPETYHSRFANVNEPQYYYCSSQIQPDDTDTCIACATSKGDIEDKILRSNC